MYVRYWFGNGCRLLRNFQIPRKKLIVGTMSGTPEESRARGGLQVETGIELPDRSEVEPGRDQLEPPVGNDNTNDLEAGNVSRNSALKPAVDPSKLLDPIRTDPIKALELRKRRMDRQADSSMPEIHYVGQIVSARNIINDSTEGVFCRWKIEHGKSWQHLGGDLHGQTQVSYCSNNASECLPFSHPVDAHFAAAGLQGWGAPRLTVQCYRLDWHGRRILAGYGFAHMPIDPGPHRLEINLWRPIGTPEQELTSFLLGHAPSLISHDPIYETAWKERCRILTVAAGVVYADVFVVTRFLKKQGIDER